MEVKPLSCVTIAIGVVTGWSADQFRDEKDPEKIIIWQKIEVAVVGATVAVKPTREQYQELIKHLNVGDQVQVAGRGNYGKGGPSINRLVAFKLPGGRDLIAKSGPSDAAANDQQATLAAYPGPSTAAPPTRRAA